MMRDSAAVHPDLDAAIVESGRPAPLLGAAISVVAAVLATALVVVLHRHRGGRSRTAGSGGRSSASVRAARPWPHLPTRRSLDS